MNTLSGTLAHNAVGALVQMYRGILEDNERAVGLLNAAIAQKDAEIVGLRSEVKSLNGVIASGKRANEELYDKLREAGRELPGPREGHVGGPC